MIYCNIGVSIEKREKNKKKNVYKAKMIEIEREKENKSSNYHLSRCKLNQGFVSLLEKKKKN